VRGGLIIAFLGILFSAFLISQCTPIQIALGVGLLLAGVPIYIKFTPKKEITELKEALLARENMLKRVYWQERTFLAHALLHVRQWYEKARRKPS
jgi:basic amino acid/polyamine antiporter, APA family